MILAIACNTTLKFLSFRPGAYQTRNFQVSVIGAASEVGSNVSMLLRNNPKVKALNLHDYDSKIRGIAKEISTLPSGPRVRAYQGDEDLECAIHRSHLILMVCNSTPDFVDSMHDVAYANSTSIEKLCKAMAQRNSGAFLGIATDPINIMVPYAYQLLNRYYSHAVCFNPYQLFGLTGIDEERARSFAAEILKVNQTDISIPVIGGHSSETIVPLFSNIALKSSSYTLTPQDIYELTTKVRKCIPDATDYKTRADDLPLSIAWSICDFTDRILKALSGEVVQVQCYMANPHFGTRYFSSPVFVGPKGFLNLPERYNMSIDERYLLDEAIPLLNKDVAFAEKMLRTNTSSW